MVMSGAERDDRNGDQGRDQNHHRREEKRYFARLSRDDVFLEEELEAVGNRLQQAVPTGLASDQAASACGR